MSSLGSSGLGSLTQCARKNQLKSARGILLGVGILTVIANLVFMALAESQVKEALDKEVQKVQQQGKIVDRHKLAEIQEHAIALTRLINGGAAALGVVFIVLGLIVNKYPVPITIAGLVLYVGATAVFAMINWETLVQGVIFKIIIIAALVKSLQSAIAYESERATEPATNPDAVPITAQKPWDVH